MAHRQQDLIDSILGEDREERDHSLRAAALSRATDNKVPRTLTPWEWEQYYAEYGVPDAHRAGESPAATACDRPWWKRLLGIGG